MLPPAKRAAMDALYAYMRVTDDLADDPGCLSMKQVELIDWRNRLHAAMSGCYSHRLHAALHATVQQFAIPTDYLIDVIDGVETDLWAVRCTTFADLECYCYRVASTVGLSCVRIWGLQPTADEEQAKTMAIAAGVAFQLTNILRDLGEDLHEGRVYLPADELAQFDCPADSWHLPAVVPAFRAMLAFQVARARRYYARSRSLANMLTPEGRAVFALMSTAYEKLLDRVEVAQEDVLRRRVRLGRLTKLRLLARTIWA